MSEETLKLKLLSPEKPLVDFNARRVLLPGKLGYMGVLPGHCSTMAELTVGLIEVLEEGSASTVHYYTSGGHVEIKDNCVTVLVETSETAGEIDHLRVEEAEKRALTRLEDRSSGKIDISRAMRSLDRARARKRLAQITADSK